MHYLDKCTSISLHLRGYFDMEILKDSKFGSPSISNLDIISRDNCIFSVYLVLRSSQEENSTKCLLHHTTPMLYGMD